MNFRRHPDYALPPHVFAIWTAPAGPHLFTITRDAHGFSVSIANEHDRERRWISGSPFGSFKEAASAAAATWRAKQQ